MAPILNKILEQIDTDDLLEGFGLQRRNAFGRTATALGLFAAGLAIGAAASLFLTPQAGSELREEVTQRMSSLRDELGNKLQSMMNKGGGYPPPS